jgi:hypothetical protein
MEDGLTSWREELESALKESGESWSDIQSSTLTDEELDKRFDDGYGGAEGLPFTVWTSRRVYFPVCYDGAEWVDSVSRFPDGKPTKHVGGG